MRRTIRFIVMGVVSGCTIGMSTIGSGAIIPAPSGFSATSEFGGPFVAASLFDATVSDADVGVTVYGVSDNQWAGVGPGPHQVYMDFGSPVTANGLAYAQRAGAIGGNNDKVGKIELWFSNSDFGGTLPASAARCGSNAFRSVAQYRFAFELFAGRLAIRPIRGRKLYGARRNDTTERQQHWW